MLIRIIRYIYIPSSTSPSLSPDLLQESFHTNTAPFSIPSQVQVYLRSFDIDRPCPSHGSAAAMTQTVTITYSSPGLQPPVCVSTSLSQPQWDVLEMDYSELPSGEREFVKTFQVSGGKHQYRFRLGSGDMWVCDEGKPTVDDGLGNRNNVLVVQNPLTTKKTTGHPQPDTTESVDFDALALRPTFLPEWDISDQDIKRDSLGDSLVQDTKVVDQKPEHHVESRAALFAHEQSGHPRPKLDVSPEYTPANFSPQETKATEDEDGDIEASHHAGSPVSAHERDDVPTRVHTRGADDDGDYMEDAPLLGHEKLSPASAERRRAPLLAYEKDNTNQRHHNDDSRVLVSPISFHLAADLPGPESHIPAEADPNDITLEKLPTHYEGILSSLHSMRTAEDETMEDVLRLTSPVTKTLGSAFPQSPSLPSVCEE